jgi:hypothetical protein
MFKKILQADYTQGLLKKVIKTYIGKIIFFQKEDLGIWEFHPEITSCGPSLYDKDDDPKFLLNHVKLGTNGYVKNVFV